MATVHVARPPAATAPRVAAPRPYRDFLTPLLHRRFTRAALVGLLACWICALPLSDFSLFWSWFPLGPAGVRTLFIFVSSLAVFTLRVAQLRFGRRSTISPFESFYNYALSRNTLHTCFWYTLSAFVFTELYIFSTANSANLAWIDPGRSYERPRLNERPVLLRCLFLTLALGQSFFHLKRDYDLLRVPKTTVSQSFLTHIQLSFAAILLRSVFLVIVTTLLGPFIYFNFLRSFAWTIALKIARAFFSLPKSTSPSGLTDLIPLFFRFLLPAVPLALLWELSNDAFTFYTAQEPTKKGKPITTDSKDPNGSLIAGLKAKKETPKAMAFWELAVITDRFGDRRLTLYQDLDRTGGSTWSQILNICLAEIQSVSQRIEDSKQPTTTPQKPLNPPELKTLPKISQPLNDDAAIFGTAPAPTSNFQSVTGVVGTVAKSYGQSAGASNPLSPGAQRLIDFTTSRVLTKEQQEQLSRAHLEVKANGLLAQAIRTPLGWPFRQPFDRRINAVIFGVPYSSSIILNHAIQSIINLVVHSLHEDRLGQVQKDIKTVVRTLVVTLQNVQGFVRLLPPHWTDVQFDGNRKVPEVEELLSVLRSGLKEIIVAFGEYATNLGLKGEELRIAKELVASAPEMEMVS